MVPLCLSALKLASWFTIAQAGVFWTEDFENHLYPNWIYSSYCGTPLSPTNLDQAGCTPTISTEDRFNGLRSLKSDYDPSCGQGLTGPSGAGCGSYVDRYHDPTPDIYMRWRVKFPNAPLTSIWNQYTGSKQMYNKVDPGRAEIFFHVFPGQDSMSFQIPHTGYFVDCATGEPGPSEGCNYYPNGARVPLNDGQWHCVETRAFVGDPGLHNGIVQIWIDNQLTNNYTGMAFEGPGAQSQWRYLTHYAQMGGMDRYIDDFAVGNSRIGCGAAQDMLAPSAPKGLSLL